jgi:hypothetical protein
LSLINRKNIKTAEIKHQQKNGGERKARTRAARLPRQNSRTQNQTLEGNLREGPHFPTQTHQLNTQQVLNLWTFSRTPGKSRVKKNKNRRGEDDGASSFYLTCLLHNSSFNPKYF